METKTILLLSLTLLSHVSFSTSFTPTDNYLVNCGSNATTSFTPTDTRIFGAESTSQGLIFLSKGKSISLKNQNPSPDSPTLYNTARVFTTASSYKFSIKRNGTHLVRLHFSPFKVQGFDLSTAKFSVLVNGNLLLSDFSTKVVVLKEYVIRVDDSALEILFRPVGESSFGYVNAIEVFSAPEDFILDEGAKLVDYIVDSNDLGVVRVSVGPSAIGGPLKINAILNGVEIMKMINPPGSRSGSKNRTVWIVVGSSIGGFAVLCLIIFVAAISCKCKKKKLKPGRVENEAWTPLRVNGELPAHVIAPQDLSDNTETETDGGDGSSSSEIRNSQVFSQLMNNDGR
ncbi:hypothetical protein OIU76_029455 [Salix suchowensis]|nr:hypothetical protein OIU76_029455 [Salix suchowensis]